MAPAKGRGHKAQGEKAKADGIDEPFRAPFALRHAPINLRGSDEG
jgi:hypothetical protein